VQPAVETLDVKTWLHRLNQQAPVVVRMEACELRMMSWVRSDLLAIIDRSIVATNLVCINIFCEGLRLSRSMNVIMVTFSTCSVLFFALQFVRPDFDSTVFVRTSVRNDTVSDDLAHLRQVCLVSRNAFYSWCTNCTHSSFECPPPGNCCLGEPAKGTGMILSPLLDSFLSHL
jgi:hypothetical protein